MFHLKKKSKIKIYLYFYINVARSARILDFLSKLCSYLVNFVIGQLYKCSGFEVVVFPVVGTRLRCKQQQSFHDPTLA